MMSLVKRIVTTVKVNEIQQKVLRKIFRTISLASQLLSCELVTGKLCLIVDSLDVVHIFIVELCINPVVNHINIELGYKISN